MVPMRSIAVRALFPCVVLSALALAACSGSDDGTGKAGTATAESEVAHTPDTNITASGTKSYVVFADFVNEADSLPRLRFRDDGQLSLNDRCAVRKVRLNPKMPPAYVNGRPVGFC